MTEPIHEIVFEHLAADGIPTATAELVLAALSSDADLESALAGRPPALDMPESIAAGPRDHIYLSSVTVTGFRGVGPERTLHVPPGPGLTVVVGRNGSGKSSFAEAAELCLTGDSARWAAKNSVWRTGWRNLHANDPCRIVTELRSDGNAKPIRVERSWSADATLDEAVVVAASDELTHALELYRPFLTAAELGKLLAGTPSELFDALGAILGMDAITDADKRMAAAIREIDARTKGVRQRRTELLAALDDIDDERARAVTAVLKPTTPDLAEVGDAISRRSAAGISSHVAACEVIATLPVVSIEEATAIEAELRTAFMEVAVHGDAESRSAINVAELLRIALDFHDGVGETACPVCRTGSLDDRWREDATVRLDEFRQSTGAARRSATRLAEAVRRAQDLAAGRLTLPVEAPDGVPLDRVRAAMAALAAAPVGPAELAAHIAALYPVLRAAVTDAREQATAWLSRYDTGWQQMAAAILVWVADARLDIEHQQTARELKNARAWLKGCERDIRDERMAPFAEQSQQIWQRLRQESNVNLGALTLTGTATRRRVDITVTVDGSDSGAALGVMSTGEMQSLGLALFLPRSCAAESPFRFVVIDDPVQSMDPAKVDGLAQVLADLASDRQIVVFTHDGRLPDAIRRLQIDARIMEIIRAERSVVTIRPCDDPVTRYLDDAYAVAKSADIDDAIRQPVVTAMCRSAIESACHDAIWRTRISHGERHAAIEAAIADAGKRTLTLVSFALFDDPDKGGDVMGHLNRKHGRRFADALRTCREGVHGEYAGDLPRLVHDVRDLTGALR